MIHHLSFSALDPRLVARTLGQIFHGPVMFAPAGLPEGSFLVPLMDEAGTFLEVVPHGTVLRAGEGSEGSVTWVPATEGTFNPNHALLSTRLTEAELCALGKARGWRTQPGRRGPFQLVEMWVENRQLLEFVTPAHLRTYRGFVRATMAALPPVPPGTVIALPEAPTQGP